MSKPTKSTKPTIFDEDIPMKEISLDKPTAAEKYEYENLCLEGGGSKGMAFCGAMQVLEERGVLQKMKRFIGSSAGSIAAGLAAVGYTAKEATQIMDETDFEKFKDSSMLPIDIYRFWSKYGYCKGDYFMSWYGKMIEAKLVDMNARFKAGGFTTKLDKDLTFQQLYDHFGKTLVITGSCVNEIRTYYFNHQSNPDMPIRLAVRISMSIPGVYVPISWKNKTTGKTSLLVDGGLFNNYPIGYFDKLSPDGSLPNSKEILVNCNHDSTLGKTLGLKLLSSDEKADDQLYHGYQSTDSVKDYFIAILDGLMYQMDKLYIKPHYWERTIPINTGTISAINFDLTREEKDFLLESGRKAATEYFLYK